MKFETYRLKPFLNVEELIKKVTKNTREKLIKYQSLY